jgi:hypothetical protein
MRTPLDRKKSADAGTRSRKAARPCHREAGTPGTALLSTTDDVESSLRRALAYIERQWADA